MSFEIIKKNYVSLELFSGIFQIIVELSVAKIDFFDLRSISARFISDNRLEISTLQNLINLSIGSFKLQQSFGVKIDQWFSVLSMHLSSQHMKVVRTG